MTSPKELQQLECDDITCDLDDFVAGSGGFGDVIFGYHNGLKQEVAIKVFEISGGKREKERLEKAVKEEMEHLLKADHENVVRIFGYVKWSFSIGIVMKYYKNGNLKELLQDTSKELGLAVRVRILYEIASAMAFCHNLPDKRLIHQDLKPENVMFTEELHCKIIDFGAAELATTSHSETVNLLARSKKERLQYTPYYTAPEKLKDPAMKPMMEHDIYAFAMIIFWLLARKAPYPNLAEEQLKKLLHLIENGKRPKCQEIQDWMQTLVGEDREIAEQLQLLMKRCWDQEPTKRPTMTEIMEQLKKLYKQQKTSKLLSQVSKTLEQMELDEQHQTSEGQRVLLRYFAPKSRSFDVPKTSAGTEERSRSTLADSKESLSHPEPDHMTHDPEKPSTAPQEEVAHSSNAPPEPPSVLSVRRIRTTQSTNDAQEAGDNPLRQLLDLQATHLRKQVFSSNKPRNRSFHHKRKSLINPAEHHRSNQKHSNADQSKYTPSIGSDVLRFVPLQSVGTSYKKRERSTRAIREKTFTVDPKQRYSIHTDSQNIGSKGGTLTAGGCQVKIPKDACNEEVKILITSHYECQNPKIFSANRVNVLVGRLTPTLKCEPEGYKFNKPIEITLPTCYRNVEASPVSVSIRHKTKDSNWEVLSQCLMDQTTRSFTFPTEHFSIYEVICTIGKFIGLMKETAIILAVPSYEEDIVSEIVAHVFICDNNESTKDVTPLNLVFDKIILLRNQRHDVQIRVSAENALANPANHFATLEGIRDSWQFRMTRTDGKNWKHGIKEIKLVISFIDSNLRDIVKSLFLENRHLTPTGPNQITNIDARGGSLRF